MATRDLAPVRLEELLRGAPPESEHEARAEGVIRELRAVRSDASPELRERVRASARRPPERRGGRRVRAVAVVAAAALVVSLGGYALTLPNGGDDAGSEPSRGAGAQVDAGGGGGDEAAAPSSGEMSRVEKQQWTAAPDAAEVVEEAPNAQFVEDAATAPQVPPSADRVRDVDMSLELRVRDADAVAAAAAEAMRAVDALGGHVAASRVDARGREASARLALRVPVARLENAVVRLSGLGTITAQNVQIEDLQGRIDGRESRIEALERGLRRVELRLGSGTLTAQERLDLELRKESLDAQLRSARRTRAELLRRGAMADVQLALHTREAASATSDTGGLVGMARSGWNVLSTLGGGAIFLLIVLSPLLLLGALAWALRRARDRRLERRILDEPRPAAARPPA